MLAQRVATAAVGIPLIIGLIIVGDVWYVAAVAAALAIAAVEFQHLRRPWLDPVSILAAALAAGMAAGADAGRPEWLAWLAATLVIMPLAALVRPTGEPRTADLVWTLGGVLYVGFLGSFIVRLRDVDFDARDWVFLALLSTWAVDTSAYFVGRAWGRRPLAPAISPKKTVEGFLGGYAGGFTAVLIMNYAFDLGVGPANIVALGLLVPGMATIGDLAESAMKRAAGVKDASELIPGHGGVLDRMDSLLFVFPVVYIFTQWAVF